MKFCQGLTDAETAYQVSMQEPKNMEMTLHGVWLCRHLREAMQCLVEKVQKSQEDRIVLDDQGYSDHEERTENRSTIASNSAKNNIKVEPSGNCKGALSGDSAVRSKDMVQVGCSRELFLFLIRLVMRKNSVR